MKQGKFFMGSRIRRSLSFLLSVLMVLTSLNMTGVGAYAQGIDNEEIVSEAYDVSENLKTDEEADNSEAIEEEEEKFDTEEYDIIPEETVLDVGTLWGDGKDHSIVITKEGYYVCTGETSSSEWSYVNSETGVKLTPPNATFTPFKRLVITGTISNSRSSIVLSGCASDASILLEDLSVLASLKTILYGYMDTKVETSGKINLSARVYTDSAGMYGQNTNEVYLYNGTITLTGDGDISMSSGRISGSAMIYLSGGYLETENYTGDLFLDASNCSGTSLITGGNIFKFETTGTIDIRGGSGSPALCASADLKASDVKLSSAGCGIFSSPDLSVYSTGNITIDYNTKASSNNLFSGSTVKLEAAGDINLSSDSVAYVSSCGTFSVTSGGYFNLKLTNPSLGNGFNSGTTKINAGKTFVINLPENNYNGTAALFSGGGWNEIISNDGFSYIAGKVLAAGNGITIKSSGNVEINTFSNPISYAGLFTVNAGADISMNCDVYSSPVFTGGCKLYGGKDVHITVHSNGSGSPAFTANATIDCPGVVSINRKADHPVHSFFSSGATITGASSFIVRDDAPIKSAPEFCNSSVEVDIPGSVDIDFGNTYGFNCLNIENASDVIVRGKNCDHHLLNSVGNMNVSGNVTLIADNSSIGNFYGTIKAKNVVLKGDSISSPAIMGKTGSIIADKVVIENTVSGNDYTAEGLTVTAKELSINRNVGGITEKYGFSGDEEKTVRILHPYSTIAIAKANKETVESVDDVDVKLIDKKTVIDPDLYTYEVGKGEKTSTKNDTVFIKGKVIDNYSPFYLIGTRAVTIAKGEPLAKVTVDEEEIEFYDFDEAVGYAMSASSEEKAVTIKVLNNVETYGYTLNNKENNLILDLNGHSIRSTNSIVFDVREGAKLTVIDSSEGKQGKLLSALDYAIRSTDGKVYIKGGLIDTGNKDYAVRVFSTYYNSHMSGGLDYDPGFINVSGGTITGLQINSHVTAEISGGKFIKSNEKSPALELYEADPADITITGGTFESAKDASGNEYGTTIKVYSSENSQSRYLGDYFKDSNYGLKTVSGNEWEDISFFDSKSVSLYVSDGRVDIAEVYGDAIGDLTDKYYLENKIKPLPSGIEDFPSYIDCVYEYVSTEDKNEYGDSIEILRISGAGEYTGHVDREFYIVSSDKELSAEMKVSNEILSTDDIELPAGWTWKEKVELSTDSSGNVAWAEYHTEVKGDLTGKFDPTKVVIYRSTCVHDRVFEYIREETCTAYGIGQYVCSKCREVLEDNVVIPATGHDYTVSFHWDRIYEDSYGTYVYCYIGCSKCNYTSYGSANCRKTVEGDNITYLARYELTWDLVFEESMTISKSGLEIIVYDGEVYEYTGAEIKPAVSVSYKGTTLTEGKDYTVSYKNNVKANIDKEGKHILQGYDKKKKKSYELIPSIVINGKGEYKGTVTKTFSIKQASADDITAVSEDYIAAPAKGKSIKPITAVYLKGVVLPSSDYDVHVIKFGEEYKGTSTVSLKNIPEGVYAAYVVVKNNLYSNSPLKLYFSVVKNPLLLSKAKVTIDKNTHKVTKIEIGKKKFTGNQITSNFDITYPEDPDAVGTHSVKIRPGSSSTLTIYGEEIEVEYTVLGTVINKKWFALDGKYTFTGEEQAAVIKLTDKAPETFVLNKDYEISYENNFNAGSKAKAVIKGIGNYRGSVTIKFTIAPKALSTSTCDIQTSDVEYNKAGVVDGVMIRDLAIHRDLIKNKDYTVKFGKADRNRVVTATITGKGNYKGTVKTSFKINNKSITSSDIKVSAPDMLFKKDGNYKSKISVTDNGKALKLNKDYKVIYDATSVKAEDIMDKGYVYLSAKVVGLGSYKTESFDPLKGELVSDSVEVEYRVGTEDASKLKIEFDKKSYLVANNSEVCPEVTVKYGVKVGLKTVYIKLPKSYYRLEYSSNTSSGTGKVTVVGLKKYCGSKTATFTIEKINLTKVY